MSYPTKAKGWRKVTVDAQPLHWHVNTGNAHAFLTLQKGETSGRQAIIYMREWHDIWLHVKDKLPPNEPTIVTPRFAEQAIRFALANGWDPDQNGEIIRFGYSNKAFNFEGTGYSGPE